MTAIGFAAARIALLLCAAAVCAGAQESNATRPQPELRVDAIDVRGLPQGTFQLGAGVQLPLGYYARLGLLGAGGVTETQSTTFGSARADVLVRFLLDPFAESPLGLSLGGGISTQYVPVSGWREYLTVLLDLELPRVSGVVPAAQVGLGGGVRLGVALRRYERGRR
jgi:hypothetical protein